MWPFFNPTIQVVTFRLRGWCMLVVFLLPAMAHLGHECQNLLSPMWWSACKHRLDLSLYSHPKEFWEDRTYDAASSRTASPTHYQRAIPAPLTRLPGPLISKQGCQSRHLSASSFWPSYSRQETGSNFLISKFLSSVLELSPHITTFSSSSNFLIFKFLSSVLEHSPHITIFSNSSNFRIFKFLSCLGTLRSYNNVQQLHNNQQYLTCDHRAGAIQGLFIIPAQDIYW